MAFTPQYKYASVTPKPLGDIIEVQLFDTSTNALLLTRRVSVPPSSTTEATQLLIEAQMATFVTKYNRTVPILPDEEIAAA